MLHDGAPSAASVDAFDLNHILQRAAVRHHSAVLEEAAALAVRLAEERDALVYMESNIRAFAVGQEGMELRKIVKLIRHELREITSQRVLELVAEEALRRLALQDAEGDDRLDIAKLKRIWRREMEAALAEEQQQRAVREAQEAAPADAATAFRAFDRFEANMRYTVTLAELRDRTALLGLHEDILDDWEDDVADGENNAHLGSGAGGGLAADVVADEEVASAVVEQQEQIRQLVVAEANVRYTIRRQQYADRAALVDLHEALWEDMVEEGEGVQPPTAKLDDCHASVENNDDVAAAAAGAERETAAVGNRYVSEEGNHGPTEADVPQDDQRRYSFVEQDEDAERQVIDDEWSVAAHKLYSAVACYLAWEYDWVLAGPRRVVRNDKDLFRSQHHVPLPMRVPQKPLLHDRLGDLERFALHEALHHQKVGGSGGGLNDDNNTAAPLDDVARTSHLLFIKDRSPVRSAARRSSPPREEEQRHHTSGASGSVSGRGRDGSPQRARNDALLQSLLFHEDAGRSALEHEFASVFSDIASRFEAELHRDLDWSLGWCPTANCRKAPRPPSYADRHLPRTLRLRPDPKEPPSTSARPPSNLYLTPQRSSTTDASSSSAVTGPLKLPVPPALIQRARSARSDASGRTADSVRLPLLALKSS